MKTIIALPGLGGHMSAMDDYPPLLSEYDFKNMEFISLERAQREFQEMLNASPEPVAIFANCYGARLALENIESDKLAKLIIIEPFSANLFWWRGPAIVANKMALFFCRVTDALGLKRKSFKQDIDYRVLAKYPVEIQPLFDFVHQSLTDYFEKVEDLLAYDFPDNIETPTLLIFSPEGYSEDPAKREKIIAHFKNVKVVEVKEKTHNIITLSAPSIAREIKQFLQ